MSWQHNYIVVDEYDNVVGYYGTKGEAICFAEGECAEGQRDTCVYAITEVATYRFTEEEGE